MTQDIRAQGGQGVGASRSATGLAGAEAPEPHSRLGSASGIPSAKDDTTVLFDRLRGEAERLCKLAFGTQEGWARYTIIAELIEVLASRVRKPASSGLIRRLRSPNYRISASTLHEAADLLSASAIETQSATTEGRGPEDESATGVAGDAQP